MDYFMMCQDERVISAVKPKLPDSFRGEDLTREWIQSLSTTTILYVEEGHRNEYPDYIQKPVMLISEKFKQMLRKYQQDIIFRTTVLIEPTRNRQEVYYMMGVPDIECRSVESMKYPSGQGEEFVLDVEKVENARIFCASDYGNQLIVRLDVAESILRRASYGIWFEKVKIVEKR